MGGFLVLAALAGCAGSGLKTDERTTGRLAVRVAWPTKAARVIPTAALSIRVQVLQGATVVNTALLTPATPSTTFAQVPIGSMTVQATAYPNADGTGTAMATAQTLQGIADNATANMSLTMASTIDHVSISPNPVVLHLLGLFTRQMTVTAYDASNAVVLTAASDWSFTTTNGLLLSVSAAGLVTGLAVGNATVTATDAASGKSATVPVQISL